jgi:AcrR family transcriptional regulator
VRIDINMAKFTKRAIMLSLLKLLKQKSVDKVTVKDICDECEINRNTFYYYFKDIYDVLNNIFMEEIEKNLREAGSNGSFYEEYSRAAAILVEYKDVVIHVYNSRNRDIITNYLEKMTAEVVRSYIAAKSEGENISEKDLEFMSYFYGYAIIGSTYKWIESGMQADFEHFIARISESIDATLPVMISKAKANSN